MTENPRLPGAEQKLHPGGHVLARSLRAGRCVLANRCSCSKYMMVQERRQFPPAVGGHRAGLSGRVGSRLRAWARGCTGQRPREPASSGEHLSSTEWPFLVRPPPHGPDGPRNRTRPRRTGSPRPTLVSCRWTGVEAKDTADRHHLPTGSAAGNHCASPEAARTRPRGRSSWGGAAVRAQADSSFCPRAPHWALGGGGTASCTATTLKTLTSRQGDVSAGRWARRVREPGPDQTAVAASPPHHQDVSAGVPRGRPLILIRGTSSSVPPTPQPGFRLPAPSSPKPGLEMCCLSRDGAPFVCRWLAPWGPC